MRIVDNKKNVSYPWQPFLCFGIYQHKNFSAADVNRLGITLKKNLNEKMEQIQRRQTSNNNFST